MDYATLLLFSGTALTGLCLVALMRTKHSANNAKSHPSRASQFKRQYAERLN